MTLFFLYQSSPYNNQNRRTSNLEVNIYNEIFPSFSYSYVQAIDAMCMNHYRVNCFFCYSSIYSVIFVSMCYPLNIILDYFKSQCLRSVISLSLTCLIEIKFLFMLKICNLLQTYVPIAFFISTSLIARMFK